MKKIQCQTLNEPRTHETAHFEGDGKWAFRVAANSFQVFIKNGREEKPIFTMGWPRYQIMFRWWPLEVPNHPIVTLMRSMWETIDLIMNHDTSLHRSKYHHVITFFLPVWPVKKCFHYCAQRNRNMIHSMEFPSSNRGLHFMVPPVMTKLWLFFCCHESVPRSLVGLWCTRTRSQLKSDLHW